MLLITIRFCFWCRQSSINTEQALVKSPVVKRSIVLAGQKTSVSLEQAFWNGLKDIAMGRRQTLSDLIGRIDAERQHGNLSSAVRLFVLNHYQLCSSSKRSIQSAGHEANDSAMFGAPGG
jgi:predicted DNA-binding ribbon-helix-helix protein